MEEKYNKFFFDLIHGIHPYETEDHLADGEITKVTVIPPEPTAISHLINVCTVTTSLDYLISVSSMVTVLQLARCNFNHVMCQLHKIDSQDIVSIELIIAIIQDIMWMVTSCCPISFKFVSTQAVCSQS
jgi:hypothetical protein